MAARSTSNFREGKIKEIAEYCESDVVNTYRMWLRYELFRGRLTEAANQASELNLIELNKTDREHEAESLRPAHVRYSSK
jgi:hypothetical protein